MIQKLKNALLALSLVVAMGAPALVAAPAYAQANVKGGLCTGADLKVDSSGSGSCPSTGSTGINDLLTKIINIFSAIVGVIAVIMIIVGGLRYITSGGDSNKVSAAKNTIIYAIIGLVIVALAQLIVRFVLSNTQNIAG
jgi:cytochrome bd-type quinol oxidase subunit 2